MNKLKLYLIVTILLSCSALLNAESANTFWPAWRGPEATGIAPNCDPPTTWSETENIKWKVKLTGDGSAASPIVWGSKIFFQTAVKTDKVEKSPESTPASEQAQPPAGNGQTPPPPSQAAENSGQNTPPGGPEGPRPPRGNGGDKAPANVYQFNIVCMDRNTGKILWEKTACEAVPHQGHQPTHGFASYSPITDGNYVWANFGSRGVYCYDFDGKLIWNQNLIQMKTMFGEGGSLALAEDAVIVVADNDTDSWIFAFHKNTGQLLWKKQRDEKTTYATPLVTTFNGQLHVITSGINKIRSYNPKTGDILWECAGIPDSMIATPIVGFDMLLCAVGGRGKGQVAAVKLGAADDQAILWQTKDVAPFVASPLLYGQRLYVFSANAPRLSCYEAKTGKVLIDKQPLEQLKDVYASPVGAADRIYYAGRNGITYVLKNAEPFEVIAINKLDDEFSCTPAVAGNELYLKGKQYFYCIANSK